MSYATKYLVRLAELCDTQYCLPIDRAIECLGVAKQYGRTIFTCGNGGSAAIASHFVCDLIKGASYGRPQRFRAICLSDNVPTITAYANDLTYDDIFLQQFANFARPKDVLFAISGSGNSRNVLNAVKHASSLGCETIALTGGGELAFLANIVIPVQEAHMGRLEDMFQAICHAIAYSFIDT